MQSLQNAVATIQTIHDEHDGVGETGPKEAEAVEIFVEGVARAVADGMNKPVGFYASAVAEEAAYHTKTNLKQRIKDESERFRGGDKDPLDEFIEERLEQVTVVKTTDHRQGAEYIWDFGTFKVETRSGKDGRGHFAFAQFRDLIHESGGVNLAKPDPDRRGGEEWRDFMVDITEERGEEKYTRGPRTEALERLSNKLKRLTGYGTAESALDHTGIWILRERHEIPEWWRALARKPPTEDRDLPKGLVQEVRVHESLVKGVIEDAEISRSAFYHELDARNLTVPGTSGASMNTWVNGSDERFWTLLPDVGTPRTYIPDPNSGVVVHGPLFTEEQEAEQQNEEVVEPGAVDAQNSSDGFDSVGDTA